MKKYSRLILTSITVFAVLCFLPMLAHAQGDDPDVPIDGGLSLLLAAGVGYGIKKFKESKMKNRPGDK